MKSISFIILFMTILIPVILHTSCKGQTDTLSRNNRLRIVPLPVIYYAPETKLGFGALLNLAFKIGKPEFTRTSNIQTYFIYTLNKQYELTTDFTLFTNQEKYIIKGKYSYLYFPEKYYGIGNDLPQSNEENIEYQRIRLENKLLRKVKTHLFVGLQHRYSRIFNLSTTENGLLLTEKPQGYQGSTASGLGFILLWDSRDNILNPYKGFYAELSNVNYTRWLGSTQQFSAITIDLRKYLKLSLKKNILLATQLYGNFILGTAPFKELSELGNSYLMRGYYRGRYRANNYYALQAELRYPLFWRIGLSTFVGCGDTSNHRNQFELNKIKPNYGLGLRFQIDKKDRVNIRLDYGFGNQSTQNFYLDIAEAF